MRLILVPLLVVAALALGSCADAGGGRSGSPQAKALLDEAFANTGRARSAEVQFSISAFLNSDPLGGPGLRLDAEGRFERTHGLPRFAFAVRGTALGGPGFPGIAGGKPLGTEVAEFTLTSTGEKAFVTIQDEDYAIGDKAFRRLVRDFVAERPTRARLNPRSWATRPRIVPADPQREHEATKVQADADWGRVAAAYNLLVERARAMPMFSGEVPDLLDPDEVADDIKNTTFEMYVDKKDKVLRTFKLQAELDAPKGFEDYDSVDVDFLLLLDRVNEHQDIAAPEHAKSPEALKRKLEELGLGELGDLVVTGEQ